MNEKLNNDNFVRFAMNNYDNPQCHSVDEFDEDLKRFLYLKKLFSRYRNYNELREKLIINHIIILYNLFGDYTTRMLFFKIDQQDWNSLITFLVFLERMPESVDEFGIITANRSLDEIIIKTLRKI
jgi:hypothetical protein